MADTEQNDLTTLTVDLLSAYFSSNSLPGDQLAGLIRSTHDALKALEGSGDAAVAADVHVPAVSVRKSLSSPDVILSMIDGKPYKTLKRHLSSHGLTPEEYRARYQLPHDYPLVSKSYSEHRRKVAADLGLGRTVRSVPDATAAAPVKSATPSPAKPAAKSKAAAAPKTKTAPAPVAVGADAPVAKPAARKTAAKAAAKPNAKAAPKAEAKVAAVEKAAPRRRKLSIAGPKGETSAK
jgi:predicted transcriptional regulator